MNSAFKSFVFLVITFLCYDVLMAQSKLNLWYNRPATDWMTEALPLGNSRMGGMVFGGVGKEHIQFNEISLWTGDEDNTGAYQNFGDLFITFPDTSMKNAVPDDYKRTLDISQSLHTIDYSGNGTKYHREYFCSFPHQVMVLNYTSDKRSAYTAEIELKDAHAGNVTAGGNKMILTGKLDNGLKYAAQLIIINKGGNITTNGKKLKITGADEFSILLTAATDYLNRRDKGWRGEDPEIKTDRYLQQVSGLDYARLKRAHIQDYTSLLNRVRIDLGTTDASVLSLPTDQRILRTREKQDPALEALLFQWGRYLLISSSRPGSLPANLQGLWNNSNTPPWRCDYHSNINIQMNYWLAEPANLPECHIPFFDYVTSLREVRKEKTRRHYGDVRGWTVQTENNIFGSSDWRWNPPGSAWYAQHFREHYAFGLDTSFLKDVAYPVLKEICQFWEDHLKTRPDGTLVTPDGWSPEHGPEGEGVTYDQEIVYDLFSNYIEAEDILGIDKEYREKIFSMRERLLKPKIGRWGQLQEWEEDIDDPGNKHRHVSHLFALHPGRQISPLTTPDLAKAARISLTARGDGATGWSMAWKMNFWARLLDGDHAYVILKNFMNLSGGMGVNYQGGGGIYANLLCAHPPFQIDGNFGYTAGVAEMLLQSHMDQIHLLPALPKTWPRGKVSGLRARGGFLVDMEWNGNRLISCTITSTGGTNAKIRYKDRISMINLKKGEKTKVRF